MTRPEKIMKTIMSVLSVIAIGCAIYTIVFVSIDLPKQVRETNRMELMNTIGRHETDVQMHLLQRERARFRERLRRYLEEHGYMPNNEGIKIPDSTGSGGIPLYV